MRSLLLFLLSATFFFAGCDEYNQTIKDVCKISDEICEYASFLCSQIEDDSALSKITTEDFNYIIRTIDESRYELANLVILSSTKTPVKEEFLKLQLTNIRDNLKSASAKFK